MGSLQPHPRHSVAGTTIPQIGGIIDAWCLDSGWLVAVRAAGPGDGPLEQALVHGLSVKSRYYRFFQALRELTPTMLASFTRAVPGEAMTLLAVVRHDEEERALAMAQYAATDESESCDFAVVVADQWQRQGIGTRLIMNLLREAHTAGFSRITGEILAENAPMLRLMQRMGFQIRGHAAAGYLRRVEKPLLATDWTELARGPEAVLCVMKPARRRDGGVRHAHEPMNWRAHNATTCAAVCNQVKNRTAL